jgi:hypothetical protein
MYIGNDLQIAHPSYKIIDDISSGFNGSTTSFALQVSGATPVPFPISTQQVMISVNGVVQEPDPNGGAGFKLLGSNIVFSSAPANGHAFFGVINAGADYVTAGSEFPDGSATAPSFTFQDDQDTGWFRSGSGAVGFSANGVNTIGFDGNGLTVTGDATFAGDSSKNLLWDKSDGQLEFADNAKAIFGTGSDLSIYHDGSHSYIDNTGTGHLYLKDAGVIKVRTGTFGVDNADGTETMMQMSADGAVELFYDGGKKLETATHGATAYGNFDIDNGNLVIKNDKKITIGVGYDLQLEHNGTNSFITNTTGNLIIKDTTGTIYLQSTRIDFESEDGEQIAHFISDGAVELFHNNSSRLTTTAAGVEIGGNLSTASASNFIINAGGASGTAANFLARCGSENAIVATANGSVDLYHNNVKTFQTNANGIDVYGPEGGAAQVVINADESDDNADQWRLISNTNGTFGIENYSTGSWVTGLTLDGSNNATVTGTVSDSKGNLRSIPVQSNSGSHTLAAASAGKVLYTNANTNVNNSVFSAGDAVTIVNNSGSDQTITQGSGLTLYNTADATTGNRTLAQRGMATIWFYDASTAYISGAGLS